MKTTTIGIITILIILNFSGCQSLKELSNSMSKSLNNMMTNITNDSSLVIAGSSNITKGNAQALLLWFKNIETQKVHSLYLTYNDTTLSIVKPGTYEFTSWAYKKCITNSVQNGVKSIKVDTVDSCLNYDVLGDYTSPLKINTGNIFKIKKGEAFYLGDFTVKSSIKITSSYNYDGTPVVIRVLDLVKNNKMKENIIDIRRQYDIPHKVINKSDVINTNEWSQGFRETFKGNNVFAVDLKTAKKL